MTPPSSPPQPPACDAFDRIDNLDALLAANQSEGAAEPPAHTAQPTQAPSSDPLGVMEQAAAAEGVLVHSPESGRRWAAVLVPAVLLMLAAFGLLGYRLGHPDWHWGDPAAARVDTPTARPAKPADPSAQVAVAATEAAQGEVMPNEAAEESKAADVQVSQADPSSPRSLVPTPPDPQPAPLVGPPRPEKSEMLADIQREADRLRAEREELEKHKREEGEKMAREGRRRPGPGVRGRGLDPAQIARRQQEMERFVRQQMAANERQFQAMRQAQERFMARQGFGFSGPGRGTTNADLDRAFQQLRREMEAFEREARGMLEQPQGRPVPPPPDVADDKDQDKVKAEGEPKDEEPAGAPAADWPPRNAPRVHQFRLVDPRTGAEVRGFQMRWGVSER